MPLSRERLRLLRSLGSRRIRHRRGLCLVEGMRALGEAANSGRLEFAVVMQPRGESAREAGPFRWPAPVFSLDEDLFAQVVEVAQSQGVVGVARIPAWTMADLPSSREPSLLLYLDGLREPGNVGGLIRTAWALGADGVLMSPGTADPFGPKAVRASAGGVFYVPVLTVDGPGALRAFLEKGYRLYLAEGRGKRYDRVRFSDRAILALGNETEGVGPELTGVGDPVAVPMMPGVDSLNVVVAGSIIAAEIMKTIQNPKFKIQKEKPVP